MNESEDDARRRWDLFDLEMDLIEFLHLTTPIRVDREKDGNLVQAIAKWAYSRDARAPMKRG